jgi:hypothetical protein
MWDAVGFDVDEESDHNIVEVLELLPEPDTGYTFLEPNLNEGLNLAKKKRLTFYDFSYEALEQLIRTYERKDHNQELETVEGITIWDTDTLSVAQLSYYSAANSEMEYEHDVEYNLDIMLGTIEGLNEGLNLVKQPRYTWHQINKELRSFNDDEAGILQVCEDYGVDPVEDASGVIYNATLDNLTDYFYIFQKEYLEFITQPELVNVNEGLNLVKKPQHAKFFTKSAWHEIYNTLEDIDIRNKIIDICEQYGISAVESNEGVDYEASMENITDFFLANPNIWEDFIEGVHLSDQNMNIEEIINEEITNLYNEQGGITLNNKDLETEIDEGTDIASVGSGGHGNGFAYINPYGTWAKNEKSMRHNQKTYWPGGSFVTVKEKCKKFPYCNQGDTGALNFSNPKAARSHALSEGLNLPKRKPGTRRNVDFEEHNRVIVNDPRHPNHPHANYTGTIVHIYPPKNGIQAYEVELDDTNLTNRVLTFRKNQLELLQAEDNLSENKDIYNKTKPMGTAHKLKEYENKLFQTLLKENVLGFGNEQQLGDENDLARDLAASNSGEGQLEEDGVTLETMDGQGQPSTISDDPHSIALEIKNNIPVYPTETEVFNALCDVGYCGKDAGILFDDVMQHLVGMGIDINLAEGKVKKEKFKPFKKMAKEKETNEGLNLPLKPTNIENVNALHCPNCGSNQIKDNTCLHCGTHFEITPKPTKTPAPAHQTKTYNKSLNTFDESVKKESFSQSVLNLLEAGTPGIDMYNKIHGESGTSNTAGVKRSMDNAKRLNTVADKTENEKLSGIGKGEPKYSNFDKEKTKEDEEYIGILRGMGLQDIQFDSEPGDDYKKRAEEAIIGSSAMGNNPDWANAQRDFDGTKGELGKRIVDTANKKKELYNKGNKEDKYNLRMKYPTKTHGETHIAAEGKMQNLKNKKIIYYEKDFDNLIPESHKVEGATFKLFDGKKTVYELKWEGNALVIESEKNNTLVESERDLFKKVTGYSVGQYKVKPKGYLTENKQ